MSKRGIEPRFLRPQRNVLTIIRLRPTARDIYLYINLDIFSQFLSRRRSPFIVLNIPLASRTFFTLGIYARIEEILARNGRGGEKRGKRRHLITPKVGL